MEMQHQGYPETEEKSDSQLLWYLEIFVGHFSIQEGGEGNSLEAGSKGCK